MKTILLPIIFLSSVQFSIAQNSTKETNLTTLAKLDFGTQGLGVSYEPRLSNRLTADFSAGAGGGYDIGEGHLNYMLELWKPAFYFSITPKYYLNRQKRSRQGKSILLNAGNYIGLKLMYVTPHDRFRDLTRNSVLGNIHWGTQRAIGVKWTFNAHFGAGYAQDIDYDFGTIYPAIG